MDVLQWSRHYRCFPGQGAFDLADFVARVLADRLRRPALARGLQRRLPPGRPRPHGDRRDALAARARGRGCPRQPARSTASRSWRSASTPSRRPRPRRCCARSGFAHVGPHRSKPVQLWQHGDIRDRAQPRRRRRRPRGRRRRRRERRSRRAPPSAPRRCSRPVLERRRGPGEADLAAVAAPDGTVGVLLRPEGGWLDDFLTLADEPANGAPACRSTRIDHITLAQPFEAFDEAGLFYRSVLDLRPGASAELAAPDGLVRSRALASRRRARADRAQRARAGRHAARAGRAPARRVRVRRRARRRARDARARRADPARSPATTTTTSRRGSTSTRRCSTRCASSASSTTAATSGELLHFYTRARGAHVLRGARAARRLRRLRRRQLARADGSAANRRRRRDAAQHDRSLNPKPVSGPVHARRRRRSGSSRSRRRCAGCSGRA